MHILIQIHLLRCVLALLFEEGEGGREKERGGGEEGGGEVACNSKC